MDLSRHHEEEVLPVTTNNAAASVMVPVTSSVTLHLPVNGGHIPATITSASAIASASDPVPVTRASGHSGHSGHSVLVPVSSGHSGHSGLVHVSNGHVPAASVIDPVTPERNENLRETLNGFSPLNGNH